MQKWIVDHLAGTGYTTALLIRSLGYAFHRPRLAFTARLMFDYGFKSLPVVSIVALFSGMILSLQTGIQMARYGQEEFLGTLVAQTFAREFGPFMTCIILVGTVVSAYTAELGTMTVSEETAALEVMSIDPVGYLATPRIVALTLTAFLLTICADAVGIIGGAFVAEAQVGLPYSIFFQSAIESLRGTEWFGVLPRDVFGGLVKAGLTGTVIGAIGCSQGLRAHGGALGVGQAVRQAVIVSIVMILIMSYQITWIFFRAFQG